MCEIETDLTVPGAVDSLFDTITAMYRAGQIRPEIERYTMDDALEAYRRLSERARHSARLTMVEVF